MLHMDDNADSEFFTYQHRIVLIRMMKVSGPKKLLRRLRNDNHTVPWKFQVMLFDYPKFFYHAVYYLKDLPRTSCRKENCWPERTSPSCCLTRPDH